jgi:hypothetical protein
MLIQREALMAIVERGRARGLRTVVGGPIESSIPAAELMAAHLAERRDREADSTPGP